MPFERPSWLPGDEKAGAVEVERTVGAFWKTNRIFEKSLEASRERAEGTKPFVFYEGPPTANGRPHPGHVLTRVMKDIFPRFHTMTGRYVPRKAGWDTHGLPVEIEVEKELGLASKADVEKYGVEPYVRKCMESVWRYTRDWEELTERIGFWVDLSDAYVTYTRDYVESVWWALGELWKKKLLYQGHKIVPWCPRCGTALSSHEVGWGYKTVDDPSVTVKFKVKGKENTYLLAWTTTPWTLLSNAALAVKPDAEYETVRLPERRGGETWVFASGIQKPENKVGAELWSDILRADEGYSSQRGSSYLLKGRDLVGWQYEPLFPVETDKPAWRVIEGEFVTLGEGTGIVHIAPAFGAEDCEAGRENDLPMICRVDPQGMMTDDTGPFAGRFCKDADKDIMRDLDERGLLVSRGTLRHEYPFCWRCESPLLYYPRAGWFIKTTQFRDRMVELNRDINWYPGHIREGRFGNFLRDNVDWALSRERYWGTPLPIWKCEACSYTEAFPSLDALRAMDAEGFEVFEEAKRNDPSLDENLAIHKPYIDGVTYPCPECSSVVRRVPEVIDCWFDSGAMPFAQWGYPAKGEQTFDKAFPADFIAEAIDQTRGWFYSLHAISTMLFDGISYRNCVVLGLVCDDKGAKMSKSKGNYVEPAAILDTQGADAMRWYFLSANQPWTFIRFTDRNVRLANKDFLVKLRNVCRFFLTYARIDGFDPAAGGDAPTDVRPSGLGERKGRRPVAERASLDRWILGELAGTVKTVREGLESYDAYGAAQALSGFVESLSNWYVRRGRSRYWGSGFDVDKADAYWTLYEALVTATLLIAPFTPFAAEEFYQTLVRSVWPDTAPESVHLCEFPAADEFPTDSKLARAMALAREASALGRAARAQAGIKVRMPLSDASIAVPNDDNANTHARLLESVMDVVEDELNVKSACIWRGQPELTFQIRPNYKKLGPELGSKVKELAETLKNRGSQSLTEIRQELRQDQTLTVVFRDGSRMELERWDFDMRASAPPGYSAASGPHLVLLLNTEITDELRDQGKARDLVSHAQGLRKDNDLRYEARLPEILHTGAGIRLAVDKHKADVMEQTLARDVRYVPREEFGEPQEGDATSKVCTIDGEEMVVKIVLEEEEGQGNE